MRKGKCLRFQNTLRIGAAVALAFLFLFGVKIANTVKLSKTDGGRTYFLHSASSQALKKNTLNLQEIALKEGESVYFLTEEKADALRDTLIKDYRAVLVKEERCLDVVSYYCYAAEFGKGLLIDGKRINLHIAVGQGRCAVGTPILFGGF